MRINFICCLNYYIVFLYIIHVLYSSVNTMYTVQPKNNAQARRSARSSCTVRTHKSVEEVKNAVFFSSLEELLETQEVEYLSARSHKNDDLLINVLFSPKLYDNYMTSAYTKHYFTTENHGYYKNINLSK